MESRPEMMLTSSACGTVISNVWSGWLVQNFLVFVDAFDHLIHKLTDPTLETIALHKLKGHTGEKIGAGLGISTRTVDRKLRLIRAIWEESTDEFPVDACHAATRRRLAAD
jgi:hypothetical protein